MPVGFEPVFELGILSRVSTAIREIFSGRPTLDATYHTLFEALSNGKTISCNLHILLKKLERLSFLT